MSTSTNWAENAEKKDFVVFTTTIFSCNEVVEDKDDNGDDDQQQQHTFLDTNDGDRRLTHTRRQNLCKGESEEEEKEEEEESEPDTALSTASPET